MKPTEQQDILLRKYLRDSLRYRETYEEVYDHMLSALERNTYTGTLEDAVNQILRDDFGGYDQLCKMENKAKSIIITTAIANFLRLMWSCFQWPALPFTIAFSVLIYFTLGQLIMPPIAFEGIFGLIILTPAVLSLRRYYVVGYLFRDTKKSIRDGVFARIAMVPTRLFVLLGIVVIINIDKGHDIWENAHPAVLTILYVAAAIYLLSLVKLYRDEFKMSIAA